MGCHLPFVRQCLKDGCQNERQTQEIYMHLSLKVESNGRKLVSIKFIILIRIFILKIYIFLYFIIGSLSHNYCYFVCVTHARMTSASFMINKFIAGKTT